MKGARGLLISITGGKDLTLYEVDEAATRIREEVDQDANIIVGATFDESLEGIIRVSVVATGIDQASLVAAGDAYRRRGSRELTQKLRAEQQRGAVERIETRRSRVATPTVPPIPQQQTPEAIEAAAKAAVAAAVLPTAIEDVTIRPIPPKPSLFPEPAPRRPPSEPPTPRAFIPPAPERTARARRACRDRRTADAGAEPSCAPSAASRQTASIRRSAQVAAAAARRGRPRPPRRRGGAGQLR